MIVIAEPYFRLRHSVPVDDLPDAARRLLLLGERLIQPHYRWERNAEVELLVQIEIGSTRIWVTVSAAVAILINYGGIRQSVDYLIEDAKQLTELLSPRVSVEVGLEDELPVWSIPKRGVPGQLARLFAAVERHKLSAEEATTRAMKLLAKYEGSEIRERLPNLEPRLRTEFTEAPKPAFVPVLGDSPYNTTPADREPQPAPQPKKKFMTLQSDTRKQARRGVVAKRDPRTGTITSTPY